VVRIRAAILDFGSHSLDSGGLLLVIVRAGLTQWQLIDVDDIVARKTAGNALLGLGLLRVTVALGVAVDAELVTMEQLRRVHPHSESLAAAALAAVAVGVVGVGDSILLGRRHLGFDFGSILKAE